MQLSVEELQLINNSSPLLIEFITRLLSIILQLEERIQELENRLNLNSSNSSIPPSKDSFHKRKIPNSRKLTNKKPGGQEGHTGTTLKPVENPDIIIEHRPSFCSGCGCTVQTQLTNFIEERQEIEIPPIQIQYIAHHLHSYFCPYCHTVTEGKFPRHITQKIQYGPRITAYVAYFSIYQLIPVKRLTQIFYDLFGCKMSQGTVINMINRVSSNLEEFEEQIRDLLINSPVIRTDETGMKVGKIKYWLHVVSTNSLTLYGIFRRRGHEGIDALGVLLSFFGVAVHDFWDSYLKYPCKHAFCNAHILRELTRVEDETHQQWPGKMRILLVQAKKTAQIFIEKDEFVPNILLKYFNEQYLELITEGLEANPPPTRITGTRGKLKQSFARNLLERMQTHHEEILRFLHEPQVPFDNNLAERDIRMPKLKMKISGLFRSEGGATAFSRIRSYVSTMQKNDLSVIDGLVQAAIGDPWMPNDTQICSSENVGIHSGLAHA